MSWKQTNVAAGNGAIVIPNSAEFALNPTELASTDTTGAVEVDEAYFLQGSDASKPPSLMAVVSTEKLGAGHTRFVVPAGEHAVRGPSGSGALPPRRTNVPIVVNLLPVRVLEAVKASGFSKPTQVQLRLSQAAKADNRLAVVVYASSVFQSTRTTDSDNERALAELRAMLGGNATAPASNPLAAAFGATPEQPKAW